MIRALHLTGLCLLASAAVWHLSATVAMPHSWYDSECCNTIDCAPMALSDVPRIIDVGPAGITVRVSRGDHPLFPEAHGERFFPWDSSGIRHSQDDDWHVCISANPSLGDFGAAGNHRIYCVYMPPFGL